MNAASLSGPSDRSMTPAMKAARLLGWVSFAIGAAELLAPKRVGRAVGLEDQTGLLRAYGARELIAGVGAHSVYPVPAMWSRVAGDLLDLGTLAAGLRRRDAEGAQCGEGDKVFDRSDSENGAGPRQITVGGERGGQRSRGPWLAIAAVAGITAIDLIVATKLSAETRPGKGEKRNYGDRSGFPNGVEAARGAGLKNAGIAALPNERGAVAIRYGLLKPDNPNGISSASGAGAGTPDNAALASATALSGDGPKPSSATPASGASPKGASSPAALGNGGQVMPKESQAVIPEPPAYTPG